MTARQRTIAACHASAVREMAPFRDFRCGYCGESFPSKKAKAVHKQTCAAKAGAKPITDSDYTPPQHLYADMRRHTSPRIKALADAEWEAMDWQGRLPDDWPERRAEIELRFK